MRRTKLQPCLTLSSVLTCHQLTEKQILNICNIFFSSQEIQTVCVIFTDRHFIVRTLCQKGKKCKFRLGWLECLGLKRVKWLYNSTNCVIYIAVKNQMWPTGTRLTFSFQLVSMFLKRWNKGRFPLTT